MKDLIKELKETNCLEEFYSITLSYTKKRIRELILLANTQKIEYDKAFYDAVTNTDEEELRLNREDVELNFPLVNKIKELKDMLDRLDEDELIEEKIKYINSIYKEFSIKECEYCIDYMERDRLFNELSDEIYCTDENTIKDWIAYLCK